MIVFIKNRTAREWGLFFFVVSLAVIAIVFASQKFGFHPCQLCIWQRWPYAAAGVFAFMLILASRNKNAATLLLSLLAVTFLIGGGIALFHLGVEYKWWEFHSDCTGNAYKGGGSVEDFLARLKNEPVVKCDQRFPFLFGMTMAFYNMFLSLGLSVLSIFAAYSLRSKTLSQYK